MANDARTTLRRLASQLPDVEEGVACAGTALESRTYEAKKSARTGG